MAEIERGEARRSILDATRGLLEQPGSADVAMAAIAERAGYSRQAIYRHFGSRAGLLKAVLRDVDERAGAEGAVAEILDSPTGVDALEALVAWWAGYVAEFVGISRSVLEGRASDPALAAAWEDRMDALLGVCRSVVDRCAEDGALRRGLRPAVASEMLWGMLSVPLWDQLITDRGWSRNQYRDRLTLMARSTLIEPSA